MDRALRDLDRIQTYIKSYDPDAAKRISQQIKASATKLKQFPNLGRQSEDIDIRLLQVAGRPYLLLYRLMDDGIEIISVFDQRRDPEDML